MNLTVKEILDGRPPLPEGFGERCVERFMAESGYIFTRRTGKGEWEGFCSRCKSSFTLFQRPGHEEPVECPVCGRAYPALSWNISRMYRQEQCNVALIQKAGENVYVRFFEVLRDYSQPPERIETEAREVEIFFFSKGKPRRLSRYYWTCMGNRFRTEEFWETKCSQEALKDYHFYPVGRDILDQTVLKHAHLEDYLQLCDKLGRRNQPMRYLIFYARRPGVERLIGAGLDRMVYQLVSGGAYIKKVKWNGRRPRDMLGLTEPEVKEAARKGYTLEEVEMAKALKPMGVEFGDSQTVRAFTGLDAENRSFLDLMGFEKSVKYLLKQAKKGQGIGSVLGEWMDTRRMMKQLGYDLEKEEYRFPARLTQLHDRMTAICREKERAEEEERAKAEAAVWEGQYRELSTLCWEKDGMLIRPVRNRMELINEGAVLEHCVGSYADRVREGRTHIFFIRKAEAPDTPWYTLNLSPKGEFIQCHGFRNDREQPVPEEVKAFWEEWMKKKSGPFFRKKQRESGTAA